MNLDGPYDESTEWFKISVKEKNQERKYQSTTETITCSEDK